jgi:cytochrome oxidase assembly protein ShyY1
MPRFRFSLRCTLVCCLLALCMLRASYWQWQRHTWKKAYIATLESRLVQEVVPYASIADAVSSSAEDFIHRRIHIKGSWDYSHEMILRNRRYKDMPGVYVITPLKIEGSTQHVLVNRGFMPLHLAEPQQRAQFRATNEIEFVALVKPSTPRRWLGPRDPEAGPGQAWVDAWLWYDVTQMQKQLPYSVLPVSLEIFNEQTSLDQARTQIVSSKSGRDDLFFLPSKQNVVHSPDSAEKLSYPVPVFDTVVPAGRHLGYVYEWAAMALATLLIGVVLQFRRPDFR